MRIGVCSRKTGDFLFVLDYAGGIRDVRAILPDLLVERTTPVLSVLATLSDRFANDSEFDKALSQAPSLDPDSLRWHPPIPDPQKILCVGLNYADHARETGKTPPPEPLIFSKLNSTLRGHNDQVVIPAVTDQVDYEAELVVVIGKSGRNIQRADALDFVAGYMCGHDVSARDWQKGKPGGQWLLGKSFDSFAPTGPWLVTKDEVDPGNLSIQLRLNDVVMQDSSTSQLLFAVDQLIEYVSQVCTLEPGDLLFTGTPAGVGAARDPQVFLQPGDIVEVEISGLGVLRNTVVAAQSR